MSYITHDRSRQDLGRANKRAVMAEIVYGGSLSRTAIARNAGLTAASVSRITKDLIEAGLVREEEKPAETGRPGRRFVGLEMNPEGGLVLGVGLNVFQQAVTLADLHNNRLERRDLELRDVSDPEKVIERIVRISREMIDTHATDRNRLFGGCVAITGSVDPTTGVLRESPYFGWHDVNLELGERLSQALDLPFQIENLPNAINLSEVRFGRARGVGNTLLVHCALGLGGSLFLDGHLVRGHQFAAGQVGNLPARAEGSEVLDDLAGGRGVLSALGEGGVGIGAESPVEVAARLIKVIKAANDGDAKTAGVLAAAGRALGSRLAMFAGLVRPEMILLSGPLPTANAYLAACRESFEANRPAGSEDIQLVASDLSNQAAARWLALGEFLVERDIEIENLKQVGVT